MYGFNRTLFISKINSVTSEALRRAISNRQIITVRNLLMHEYPNTTSDDGLTPLHLAVWNAVGSREGLEVVEALLAAGAYPNATDRGGATPLHVAVWRAHQRAEDLGIVRALLAAGANPDSVDARGSTPLVGAISKDQSNAPIVRALVEAGANVNARNELDWSPLDQAVFYGWPELAAYLRSRGAGRSRFEGLFGRLAKFLWEYQP